MKIISKSESQTIKIAQKLAKDLKGGEVLCLYGDLGSGKTVFCSGVINFFLTKKRVVSPTFIIVRQYVIKHKIIETIYHFDLYRVTEKSSIIDLGLLDLVNKKKSIILIEWADRLKSYLPKKRIDIFLSLINQNKRVIKIISKNEKS